MHTILIALLLLHASACLASDSEQWYLKGIKLRDSEGAGFSTQHAAAQAFLMAADLAFTRQKVLGLTVATDKVKHGSADATPLPGYPHILVPQHTHAGALRELAKAFQDGRGVDMQQGVALELFRMAAARGDPEAQGRMGVLYAFGLHHPQSLDGSGVHKFGQVNESQAVLHYYFGAQGGDTLSRTALAYRHLYGLGVPKSCWAAAEYLQLVAEEVLQAAARPSSLPHVERIRLNVHAGQGMKADRQRELLQFYQYNADRGNVEAQTTLGQVLNYGTHGINRDHSQALHYFQKAADADDAEAMAHLGHMYAAGYGTAKDMDQAVRWFEKASDRKQPSALFALGYIHLTGTGAELDYTLAMKYFSQAAELGHPEAHFHVGLMHMKGWGVKRRSATKAFAYFSAASQGNHLLGMYNTAMMHFAGKGTAKKCRPGVLLLKQIAERGPVAAVLQSGHEQFFRGHYSAALLGYLAASELGMELAQSNAAWMLQQGYGQPEELSTVVAVALHKRAAAQGNVAALLALGDAHFYGKGAMQDWVRAAAIYYEAYQQRSAEACFNLGFMHEFAVGVPKDLFLSRKFYNMARHKQPDAVVPVQLANAWLTLHEQWDVVRPHLPAQLDFIWDHVFTLRAPATSPLGAAAELLGSLPPLRLGLHGELLRLRLGALPGIPMLVKQWEGLKETGDTALLIGLLLSLLLVLHLRSRRQANVQVPEGNVDPPFAPAAELPAPTAVPPPSTSAPTPPPQQPTATGGNANGPSDSGATS